MHQRVGPSKHYIDKSQPFRHTLRPGMSRSHSGCQSPRRTRSESDFQSGHGNEGNIRWEHDENQNTFKKASRKVDSNSGSAEFGWKSWTISFRWRMPSRIAKAMSSPQSYSMGFSAAEMWLFPKKIHKQLISDLAPTTQVPPQNLPLKCKCVYLFTLYTYLIMYIYIIYLSYIYI